MLAGTWRYKVSADLCVVQVWVLGFGFWGLGWLSA